MDPKHSGDVVKHLEKQNELMMDAYRSMSHELQRLQIEEQMMMRKFHEFMTAQGFIGKTMVFPQKTSDGVNEDEENSEHVDEDEEEENSEQVDEDEENSEQVNEDKENSEQV